MIVHLFNCSVVSGPETLVVPALSRLGEKAAVVFLSETRVGGFSKEPPAYARGFGLEVHEITVRSRWDRLAIRELSDLLSRLAPRIVHAHSVKPAAYVAAAVPAQRPYRIFATNHGIRANKAPKLRLFEWLFTHWVMPRFDQVFVVCSSDRELLIRRGISPEKVRVHLNGIDKPKVALAERASVRRRIHEMWQLGARGVSESSVCFGVVGRLAPEKRHRYILDVFKKVLESDPAMDAHLVVFGRGALEQELKRAAEELGVSQRVHWLGYRGTVGDEMAGFDVLFSLSFAEGLPINLIEAGWAATPVVATGVDGNLDLMPTADHGLLFRVEDSVETVAVGLGRLARDPALRSRMGETLQRRVESCFSGRVWLESLREFYR